MSTFEHSNLRFNFGFLLEAPLGTSRDIELNYPAVKLVDVLLAPLQGTFRATRNTQGIYIEGVLLSQAELECARCLEPYTGEISMPLDELYYYPAETAEEGAYVVHKDGNVDLGPLVRELAVLAIPFQPICRPDCLGLCIACGQNLNERDCGCADDDLDPRMAVLRNLLDDHSVQN